MEARPCKWRRVWLWTPWHFSDCKFEIIDVKTFGSTTKCWQHALAHDTYIAYIQHMQALERNEGKSDAKSPFRDLGQKITYICVGFFFPICVRARLVTRPTGSSGGEKKKRIQATRTSDGRLIDANVFEHGGRTQLVKRFLVAFVISVCMVLFEAPKTQQMFFCVRT